MRLALFGPPGAGKGTQASFLKESVGLKSISTGNLIRSEIRNASPIGQDLENYIQDGGLVPDTIVQDLAQSAIAKQKFNHYILDGFPRTVGQAHWLADFLDAYKMPLQLVVSLSVPDNVLVERLSQRRIHKLTCEPYHLTYHPPPKDVDASLIVQRKDDRPEAVRNRLATYRELTLPVEEFYEQQGLLVRISGLGSNIEIQDRILSSLKPFLSFQPA